MFNNTFYMFGDYNQCEPVEAGSQIHYEYLRSKTIQQMRSKKRLYNTLKAHPDTTKKAHEMLAKILKTGRISTYFKYGAH